MSLRTQTSLLAVAAALTLGIPSAWAQVTPKQEDAAQLKADEASLARERAQDAKDVKALKADKAEGKMSAESKDSMRVYRDKQSIRGEKKDMAADRKGSLQGKEDKTELKQDKARLKADAHRQQRDNKHGRMAATSPDAEKVYQDQQAIKGQEKAIAEDKAKLGKE
ncbi:MAG: hypothetical protein JSR23_01265 [Proteobacteria bacterium]|nr:hypothetical protein [Pseudomonadota bacterium]